MYFFISSYIYTFNSDSDCSTLAIVFYSLTLLIYDFDCLLQVYMNYENSLGACVYRELFNFNAEPPWDPSR